MGKNYGVWLSEMTKVHMRNNRGYILLEVNFGKKKYRVTPVEGGRIDDKLSVMKAEMVIKRLELDLSSGIFSGDMSQYKYSQIFQQNNAINNQAKSEIKISDKVTENKPLIMEELINRHFESKKRHLEPNSFKDYKQVISKLQKCPHKTVDKGKQIIIWLKNNNNGTRDKTLNKQLRILKSACEYAIALNELTVNPFNNYQIIVGKPNRKTEDTDINPYTVIARDSIIKGFYDSEFSGYYAPFIEFLFFTGCRSNEARAIQWNDIDFGSNKIIFRRKASESGEITNGTKTKAKRVMPLDSRLLALLTRIKPHEAKPSDLIFPSKEGKVINWSNFSSHHWRPILKSLPGIEYRKPYQTRHTYITLIVATGKLSATVIGKWVGNSTAIIEKHYLGDVSDVPMPEI
ncbi:hypothetical protein DSM106972_075190 [Dulcicalothrix desertica PCC 7102]|uniref:Tyr recombinase domain-containing protein n=1 Tax=Dulcicalothrix desertica PCC 7102 TaxID=232991 RepID=A0A433V2T0_9CYAN|nr:site-specific integrase [Dulcicalothrix desertica]RUT00391.1 hypothetical protein DSM106972_075190 [Dulcicalothrix desertica PCC 7102]TWH42498.1 integrase [Dulcicalothrix desertica PCC 7102]